MIDNSFITNSNGRFWAGMTIKDAQLRGVDKNLFRRDFNNLDKNKDGILSVDEIMQERKRDANVEKWCAVGFGAWGLFDYFTTKKSAGKWLWLGFDAFVTALSAYNYHKIKEQDKRYNEILASRSYGNFNRKA